MDAMKQRRHPDCSWVPFDPWWPRRVEVEPPGSCVPYQLMLLWHWQFFLDGPQIPTEPTP